MNVGLLSLSLIKRQLLAISWVHLNKKQACLNLVQVVIMILFAHVGLTEEGGGNACIPAIFGVFKLLFPCVFFHAL